MSNLRNYNFSNDYTLNQKVSNQITIINDKINPLKKELPFLLETVVEKESKLAKRLSVAVQEAYDAEKLSFDNNNNNINNAENNYNINVNSAYDSSIDSQSNLNNSSKHSRAQTLKS